MERIALALHEIDRREPNVVDLVQIVDNLPIRPILRERFNITQQRKEEFLKEIEHYSTQTIAI
jgi:hypothetical protein